MLAVGDEAKPSDYYILPDVPRVPPHLSDLTESSSVFSCVSSIIIDPLLALHHITQHYSRLIHQSSLLLPLHPQTILIFSGKIRFYHHITTTQEEGDQQVISVKVGLITSQHHLFIFPGHHIPTSIPSFAKHTT